MSASANGPIDPIGTGYRSNAGFSQPYEEDKSLNTDIGHKEISDTSTEGAGDIRAVRANSVTEASSSLPRKKPFDPNRGKTGYPLHVMRLRFYDLRLSQKQFSKRFGFGLGALRDLEQGRGCPSMAARTLIEAIRLDPDLVARAAEEAKCWVKQ